MKYCVKCGWEMQDDEVYCRNCGTKSSSAPSEMSYNSTPYDDTPPKQLGKGAQTVIKVLLILSIVSIVFGALQYFLGTSFVQEIVIETLEEMMLQDPEMQEIFGSINSEQLADFVGTVSVISGIVSLIPLCWTLPMTKKIFKAMKEGTPLTTGFKICTLLFVNLIAGIVLLCSQDI